MIIMCGWLVSSSSSSRQSVPFAAPVRQHRPLHDSELVATVQFGVGRIHC
jgi:hypothetical protein